MRIRLTRAVSFRAHHRLADPRSSPEENRARFGWTVEPHPHHYRCEVGVSGPVAEDQAAVIDLEALDRILAEEVLARLEGKHLHRDVQPFDRIPPTCEAIARDLFRRIAAQLPAGVALDRVMVAEDSSLHAECFGST